MSPAVACPSCNGDAIRGGHRDSCSCGWRDDLCVTCGKPMRWDSGMRMTTCGGLDVVGALVCCANVEVSYSSRPADAVDWRLAKGGRSVHAGGIKLRAEAGADEGDVVALMARVVRVPALELEVERLRAALARRERGAA